jgi:type I restriction enzyme S subunit
MLLSNVNLLAKAPNGVARLRELILTLAVQGKLVPQDPKDEPASELLKKIRVEKDRLIAEGKIKRDKPLAEIAEEEMPFLLPSGWEWERFGAIAGIERGGSPRPIDSFLTDDPDGLNWIKIGDTEKGGKYITSASQKIRREGLVKTRMVFPGDFLLTNSMSFGRPYITQIEGCIHDGWLRISPPSSLNKDYLYLLLSSRFIRTVFEAAAAGGVVLNLNADKVRTVPIPLPPLVEQSRIVTRVEELMRLCDALEAKGQLEATQHTQLVSTLLATLTDNETPAQLTENWHRIATHFDLLLDRPQAVDALEQTILQLAVRGLLVPQDPQDEPASELLKKIRAEKDKLIAQGKIKRDKPLPPIAEDEQPFALPPGWEWVRIETLADVGTGTTPSRDNVAFFANGSIPWVTSGETGKPFIAETAQHVTEFALLQTNLTVYPVGTLVLAMYGQGKTRGQVSELQIEATTNQACAAIVLVEQSLAHRSFVKLVFEKSYDKIRQLSAGGAQPNLNVGKIKATLIPLPPLAEQSRIVTRVAQLRRLCSDLRKRLTASQSTQAHLAEALVQDVA